MAYPFYPNYQQYYNPYVQQNANLGQNQQIQNGGFVAVRSEDEARNYPVAPGNSVTFRNEAEPFIYTKTMGFSQLDRPVFERYRLVKEETEAPKKEVNGAEYAKKEDFDRLKADFDSLSEIVSGMTNAKNSTKKAVKTDD